MRFRSRLPSRWPCGRGPAPPAPLRALTHDRGKMESRSATVRRVHITACRSYQSRTQSALTLIIAGLKVRPCVCICNCLFRATPRASWSLSVCSPSNECAGTIDNDDENYLFSVGFRRMPSGDECYANAVPADRSLHFAATSDNKQVPKTPHWPSKIILGSDKESDTCCKNTVPGDNKFAVEGGS